ncbi:unnamed protein product [Pleuronectes platessa]|uniref:Uncharacterized protein n=1 Tax=Pleuronectes platessa TaxID=8262 RepID=A0A9N7UIK9_PLEPL|nr:unnamed protein product [Pleuronectes platessa]
MLEKRVPSCVRSSGGTFHQLLQDLCLDDGHFQQHLRLTRGQFDHLLARTSAMQDLSPDEFFGAYISELVSAPLRHHVPFKVRPPPPYHLNEKSGYHMKSRERNRIFGWAGICGFQTTSGEVVKSGGVLEVEF